METRNMVGMTDAETMRWADGRRETGWVGAVFAVCAMALLVIAAGWLVYLACGRWPGLARTLPPLGFVALGVALQMTWSHWRKGA